MMRIVAPAVVAIALCSFASAVGAPLRPPSFRQLPVGSVRAERWLLRQLELQRDGLTGHAEELFDDIGRSDWFTGEKRGGEYAWERGPYYLKGLLTLAWTLDDAELKARAKRHVEEIFAGQRANGDFGPRDRNWWANMVVLHFVREYVDATGDERGVAFLSRYFDFQAQELPKFSFSRESIWADQRAGDELEVVLWLYERTGEAKWLDFARLVASQACRARDSGKASCGTGHIVNYMQSLKTPALQWRLGAAGNASDGYFAKVGPKSAAFAAYGRPDRMLNGSETLSDRRTSEGTELCAIAERMLSCRTTLEVSGDGRVADDWEVVAYNALPATLPPDLRGTRYYNILNQPCCDERRSRQMQANGGGEATCPGPEAGYGCCRSNWHQAWPKFVAGLWMRATNGLVAAAYGPCRVKAEAGGGIVEIREKTDYPFRETVDLEILSSTATEPFALYVRVPGWCEGATVEVNGVRADVPAAGRYAPLVRAWRAGDRVSLRFPMRVTVSSGWWNGSACVLRGPLVFAHAIPADVEGIGGKPGFPKRRLTPMTSWNDVLVAVPAGGGEEPVRHPGWRVEELPVADQPFDPATPSVRICAEAVSFTYGDGKGWGQMDANPGESGRVVEPFWGVLRLGRGGLRDVKPRPFDLQPVGATELRITLFPLARFNKEKQKELK